MKTIGIVEDDRLLNEALAKMLEKNGYQPLQAHTLEEGMKLIRQKPELIILDINLPDGEGTRICQAAREYSRIPVLFLTARDEEEDMLQAFDLGADDYLVKPFSMAVLLKHVEAVLRRTQGEKEVFLYRGLTIDPERKQVAREGRRDPSHPKGICPSGTAGQESGKGADQDHDPGTGLGQPGSLCRGKYRECNLKPPEKEN